MTDAKVERFSADESPSVSSCELPVHLSNKLDRCGQEQQHATQGSSRTVVFSVLSGPAALFSEHLCLPLCHQSYPTRC